MISLLVFLARLGLATIRCTLVILNWATALLALIVSLQLILRGVRVREPVDLDTFVCNYLYHPLVARLERYLQWVRWPRRRRGLAWLLFILTVEAVLLTTSRLSGAIQSCSAALSLAASAARPVPGSTRAVSP